MGREHRREERNRRQTGSCTHPTGRLLVSSEFKEGSFIPRQTGIACASERQAGIVLPLAACALLKEGRIVYTSSWPSALSACALLLPSPTSACPALLLAPCDAPAPATPRRARTPRLVCVRVCVWLPTKRVPWRFPWRFALGRFPWRFAFPGRRSRTLWRASINEFLIVVKIRRTGFFLRSNNNRCQP